MERKANRSGVVALALVGLLVAYLFSVGPAALLHTWVPSAGVDKAIRTIYAPLSLLPPSLAVPLGEWANLWQRKWGPDPGPRR